MSDRFTSSVCRGGARNQSSGITPIKPKDAMWIERSAGKLPVYEQNFGPTTIKNAKINAVKYHRKKGRKKGVENGVDRAPSHRQSENHKLGLREAQSK